MRTGPQLAGLGRHRLFRIVQRPQGADRRIDIAVEEMLVELQRHGENPHDSGGQIFHRPIIGFPGVGKTIRAGRPDRRRIAEAERLGVGHARRHGERPTVEAFLQVRWRVDIL